MYKEIKIVNPSNIGIRAYVEFYHEGKRFREYNAKKLSLEINPNRLSTLKLREQSLKKLQLEFLKAFDNGWYPNKVVEVDSIKPISLITALTEIFNEKLENDFSQSYKRDLKLMFNKFTNEISSEILQMPVENFDKIDYGKFLSQFKSSSTYYMNKRRILGVFFSELIRKKLITYNPLHETSKQKTSASLHQIYLSDQIKPIFKFLKENYPNLYICCLLTYGCFLRPHQESRLLRANHINDDCSIIKLSGTENKSKRIRVVNVPEYVKVELKAILSTIKDENHNIISRTSSPYNVSYFNTQWSRAKKKMLKKGLIQKNQTIYSFRHTSAVQVYRKTKDLNILQQLLGHSNMIVTLKYLRGLGEANNDELKHVMPTL